MSEHPEWWNEPLHERYGPCDGLGPNGSCTECHRVAWLLRRYEEQDEFLRALADQHLPHYETKIALNEDEARRHGVKVGDTYRVRHDPPLFGWPDE